MTNKIALILFVLICGVLGLDHWFNWGGTMFMLHKSYDLLNWVIFWR